MTLFSIECATCKAKLNVNDVALIGQILACPKCGSMVMVEAPKGFQAPGDSEADEASTSEAPEEPSASRPHCDSRADTKPMAVPQPDELGGGPTSRPMPADWSSDESRQMRRLLVLSGVGVGAVVLAVALGGFWVARNRRVAAVEPVEAGKGPDTADENGSAPPIGDGENDVVAEDATGTDADANSSNDTGSPNSETGAETADSTSSANESEQDTGTGAAAAPNADNETVLPPESDTADSGADTNTDGGQDAPPGFDPTPATEKEDDIDTKAVAESLRRLEELLAPGASEDENESRIEIERRATMELAEKPPIRNIDIPVQLRRPVLAMKFDDVPLIKFTRFLSEMSTIPIAIDPVALRARGLRSTEPVAVDLEETTVEAILRAAIEPLGLAFQIEPNQVRIVLPSETTPSDFEISDLTADNPQQFQQLSTWITTLIAPTSWTGAGGEGTLVVEGKTLRIDNASRVRYEAGRLLDRIRQARLLERKSDIPAAELELGLLDGSEFMAQSVNANFRIPVYFTEILSTLGESADVDILVDWESVAEAGWNPEGKTRLRIEDAPLTEALEKLLEPMELDYRIAGDRLLVITAAKDERPPRPIYFHNCDAVMETLGGDEQALSQLLSARIGARHFHPQGPIAAFYDVASKHLMVAGPLKLQRRIAKLLKEITAP